MSPLFGYPTCPADKEEMIKCPFIYCLAGPGLAGSGRCGLFGCWWHPACGAFVDEEQWITESEAEAL